jgi:hypothetical protein
VPLPPASNDAPCPSFPSEFSNLAVSGNKLKACSFSGIKQALIVLRLKCGRI